MFPSRRRLFLVFCSTALKSTGDGEERRAESDGGDYREGESGAPWVRAKQTVEEKGDEVVGHRLHLGLALPALMFVICLC